MLCVSAAPGAPGLFINATRYMNIHDVKPRQPSRPGITQRGERASEVGGSCTMAQPAPACLPPARSMRRACEETGRAP